MPTVKVAVGCIIEQGVMNELLADIDVGDSDEAEVTEEEGGEIITLNPVICKVITWEVRLTLEQKSRIPEILWYVRNDNDTLDPCSFFVRTRWEYVSTREEAYEKSHHFESDAAARQRFMEVFGRGIQESHMKFATRPFPLGWGSLNNPMEFLYITWINKCPTVERQAANTPMSQNSEVELRELSHKGWRWPSLDISLGTWKRG
ncbi:hypothetical protein PISMIDRAFT_18561 [Pisolithus microcarpus 441]|uniref:Unplaced genomic scaffold scaffold_373, whole genome shotgun sequence n=1 Tax=Pisolithus microcarpus 441 TaxID=765257 RepID=A0A0C9YXM1_9AGAM|nr:hypothetical protein PISMIDRAFT_18561 [Pisolithus microcarpus 441]